MVWTDPPIKTNGVDNVSKADCNTYIKANLEFLRAMPSAKIEGTTDTTVATGSATVIDYSSTTETWDSDSLHDTSIDHLDMADVNGGNWLAGATVYYDENTTGDRRLGVIGRVGTTDLSRIRTITNEDRKVRMSASTVATFTTANDGVQTQAFQTSGGNLDARGDMWGQFLGDESTASSTVALQHTALDEDVGVTNWWSNWRSNAFRLYRRPMAKITKTSAQSVSDNTATSVTFGSSSIDTAGMVNVGNDNIDATYDGYYYCTTCVGLQSYNGTSDYVTVQFRVNASTFGIDTASYEVNSGSSYVVHEDVIRLTAGDTLDVIITKGTTGGSTSLVTGTEVHLSATLMSGDISSTLVPEREFFTDGLPDLSGFGFDDPDSTFLPRGLANLYTRDVFAHLWNPPVLSLQAETAGNALQGQGWTDIRLDVTRYDNWSILDSLKTQGGVKLPWDGVFLVVGTGDYLADDSSGATGDRGLRIKHGSKNVSPVRTASATSSGAGWARSTSGLINGTKDDVITLQGLSSAGDEVTVQSALLHVIPIRDKVT